MAPTECFHAVSFKTFKPPSVRDDLYTLHSVISIRHTMRYFALGIRPSINAVKKCCVGRAHHSATAELVRIGSGGITVTGKVGVWLGKPEEAYVMLPPETSHDLQAGSLLTGGCSLTKDLKTYPLSFYHDTRHFAHGMLP